MDLLIVIGGMVIVGLAIGFIAGLIWKDNRPIGVSGDYVVAVISAVVMGLIDWYVVPAMGFSEAMKWMALLIEPALTALLVLWLIRVAKKNK